MTMQPRQPLAQASRDLVSAELRHWIQAATGLLITDDNAAPVDLALRIQAEQLRLPPEQFRTRLMQGSIGAQPFIDEITTHESYFFRAREQMQLVVEQIIPERLRRAPGRRVRVLSLPCARGEEPYSLAILCEEVGIAPALVEIVGGDIAHACIETARSGVFGPLALRRTDPARAQRWFRPAAAQALRLDPRIVARVAFRRVNLLQDAERLLRGPFDIVFCENLLIYFDAATVERALAVIGRLLAEDGWLFVDHAEWNLPRRLFDMQEMAGRVGFRPKAMASPGGTPAQPGAGAGTQGMPLQPKPATAAAPETALQRPSVGSAAATPKATAARPRRLDSERQTLPAAARGWERQLQQAQADYGAKRFSEAMLGFERALRLQPDQPEALLGKARVLADCGEDIEAMETLESLLGGNLQAPNARPTQVQTDALGLMAVLLHKKGLRDLAVQYLRRVSMLDPAHPSLGLLGRRPDA
jgi:chemotaxis protein methyltransferase WspC